MLFMVVALFAICWFPFQFYNILSEIYPSINEYRFINIIFFACHFLAMSNSCYNVFIYAIYSERFKSEFQSRFNILCFWTKWFDNTRDTYSTSQDCNTLDMTFHDRQNLSVNRVGSFRSQTQYSDISYEKRSPRTAFRLSIKPNCTAIQANNSQITLNGLYKDKNNNCYQNGNHKINNQLSLSRNKKFSSNSLTLEKSKCAQSSAACEDQINKILKNGIQILDEKNSFKDQIDKNKNGIYKKENDQNDQDDRDKIDKTENKNWVKHKDNGNTFNYKTKQQESIKLLKNHVKSNEIEFPKLKKLIQNELKNLNNKQLSRKLIRCNTAIEIDYYTSRPCCSKIAQNRKLIFSQTIE